MKFSKIFNKKKFQFIFRCFVALLVIAFTIIMPLKVIPNFLKAKSLTSESREFDFMGVLEVWHIETFEGGSVSRSSWLEKKGTEFSKLNEGCYLMINTMSLEQVKLNLESGKRPNMFSFGIGVGATISNYLSEYTGKVSVRDDLLDSGTINNKIYAIPYILGGYAIFTNNELTRNLTNVGFGTKDLNNFAVSLLLNNYKIELNNECENIDSFTAYDRYINERIGVLVGTQRDSYRVNNRISNGKMSNQNIKYLGGFSDLIQYMAIASCNTKEYKMCEKFIEYLQTKKVQSSLTDINMFSTIGTKLYTSGYLNEIESQLQNNLKTINVFLNDDILTNLRKNALDYITNKTNDYSYVKKYLLG